MRNMSPEKVVALMNILETVVPKGARFVVLVKENQEAPTIVLSNFHPQEAPAFVSAVAEEMKAEPIESQAHLKTKTRN